jgi:hypothetical protein
VSFWRRQVVDFALDRETQTHIVEQRAWILREPLATIRGFNSQRAIVDCPDADFTSWYRHRNSATDGRLLWS